MQRINKLFRNSKDEAISPVIGTILMVAATVIIAGAVYAAVNAYNGRTTTATPDAAFKAQAYDTDSDGLEDTIKLTYLSGPAGAGNVVTNVSDTDGDAADVEAAHSGNWDPGEFATYSGSAGTYFITVRMGDATVLDQSISLKE
jgi:flagellin-like protein